MYRLEGFRCLQVRDTNKYKVKFGDIFSVINCESPKVISFDSCRCMEISSIAALLRIKSLEKVKAWATCDI